MSFKEDIENFLYGVSTFYNKKGGFGYRIIKEENFKKIVEFITQDGIVCPRCCEKFHDVDVNKNPELFYECPNCSILQHIKCRGNLDEINPEDYIG